MTSIAIQPAAPLESLPQENASLEEYRAQCRKSSFSEIKWSSVLVLIHVLLLCFNVISFWMLFRSIFFVIGLAGIAIGVWGLRQASRLTLKDLDRHNEAKEFGNSVEKTQAIYTKIIVGCLITVAVFQLLTGEKESIQAAGLVKSAVRDGEFWRLLTCTTLHANTIHIWMNCQALLSFGKLLEGITVRAYLTIVFLISALCGSLFSLILIPNTTSVGASGGLMGLVGFLAVFGYRRKNLVPADFFKSIMINIGFIGVVGLIGFAIVDNAAHLGGLVAGAAIGAVSIKRDNSSSANEQSGMEVFGFLSLLIIAGISIFSIVKMLN